MPLSPAAVRALFPAASRYAYLNAAASSPMALPVQAASEAHLREMVEQGDASFPRWLDQQEDIRRRFAAFIGASPSEVAFLPSTSIGFHVVADALWQLGVRQVLTFAQEFPSTTLPLLHRGLQLLAVGPRPDGSYAVEDVERALTPSTRAVAISAVQYASGFRVDLQALGELCRARGVYLAVNGAQALGQIPLQVHKPRLDFLCGTSHKWMMGGFGTGLFFARGELFGELKPTFASWLSTERPMAMDPFVGSERLAGPSGATLYRGARFRSEVSTLEAGCGSFLKLFGFGAALALIEQVGMEEIEGHNARLQTALRQGLGERGFVPTAPKGSGICVVKVAGDPDKVASSLLRHGVAVSARGGGLRVSTHLFNDESDLDRLFDALERAGVRPQ